MSLALITDKQRKCVMDDIQLDEIQMRTKIEQIKQWMKKQTHLPEVPDYIADKMIFGFLLGTKMSTEIVKYKIDTYYAMRHQIPEVFLNRDPTQQDVRDSVDVIRLFPLSELTPDGIRVEIVSYNSEKGKKFTTRDLKAFYKRIMAMSDARWQQDEFCRGEYLVMDCAGFYLSHVTELPWLFVQRWTALAQIHVFQGDHTNLYKYIPKRLLPSDYGGESPCIEESSRAWQKTIESMRDFLIEDEKRKTDESKRPSDSTNDCGQLFGINGTFNKLNID